MRSNPPGVTTTRALAESDSTLNACATPRGPQTHVPGPPTNSASSWRKRISPSRIDPPAARRRSHADRRAGRGGCVHFARHRLPVLSEPAVPTGGGAPGDRDDLSAPRGRSGRPGGALPSRGRQADPNRRGDRTRAPHDASPFPGSRRCGGRGSPASPGARAGVAGRRPDAAAWAPLHGGQAEAGARYEVRLWHRGPRLAHRRRGSVPRRRGRGVRWSGRALLDGALAEEAAGGRR